MSRYCFAPATLEDDAHLRQRMAAEWMRGPLSVSFRREPSYFAGCALQGEDAQVYTCVDSHNGVLVGMAARLMTQCYVNGEPQRVGLLSDLRLAQHARGGTLVARGFKVLRALHEADPVPFYLTAILDGNHAALSTITSGRAGLPLYRDIGVMRTPAIHLDLPKPPLPIKGVQFRRATVHDTAALMELHAQAGPRRQFSRVMQSLPVGLAVTDYFVAESGSRLLGCIAAWDQHALRQTHIEAYTPWLAALRPVYNAVARLLPLKTLPTLARRLSRLFGKFSTVHNKHVCEKKRKKRRKIVAKNVKTHDSRSSLS